MKNSCLNCPDRKPLCHSTCEKYKALKAEYAKRREARDRSREAVELLCEGTYKAIAKRHRSKRK